jgi:hypothetical protein
MMFPDVPVELQQAVNDKVISAVEQGVKIRRKIVWATVGLVAAGVAVLALVGITEPVIYAATTTLIGLLAVVYTVCTLSASLNSQLDAMSAVIIFYGHKASTSQDDRHDDSY